MTTRKQRIVTVLAVLFLSAPIVSCKGQQNGTPPKETTQETKNDAPVISAIEPQFDFGKVRQGTEVSHIYKIKNIGSKELVIEKTHGS